MSTTGSDLLIAALQDLEVLGGGETTSAEDMALALATANRMLSRWMTQRLLIFELTRTVKTLTNAKASYTIGPGGEINIPRPLEIDHAALVQDATAPTPLEVPIQVFTDDDWNGIGLKTLSGGYAQGIYFNHGSTLGLGTIQPWPVPNIGSTQLVLYTPTPLGAITLAGVYTFPDGYEDALVTNLAKRLAIPFGKTVSRELDDAARESLADIKRANVRMSDLALPFGGGRYDITSDTVWRR